MLEFIDKVGALILFLAAVAIAVFVYFLFYKLLFSSSKAKVSESLKKRRELIASLNAEDYKLSREEKLRLFVSRNGVNYRLRRVIKPSEFLGFKFMWATGFTIFGLLLSVLFRRSWWVCLLISGVCFLIGFFILDLYYKSENKEDNKKMLKDIHTIYDTLRVYLKTGTYVTDTLDECYYRVANKRLKKALLELKEGIKRNSSKEDEIVLFQLKFDSVYIDIMVNILTQYFRTDSVATLLDDITEQMVDLDHAINMVEKEKLDTQIFIKTFLLYGGVLAGIVVTVILSVGTMLNGVF